MSPLIRWRPIGLIMMYRVRAKTVDPEIAGPIMQHARPKSIQRGSNR
jgi:hypothetical protein